MDFDKDYILKNLEELLKIDSPTGFTHSAMEKVEKISNELGFSFERTKKGNGIISIDVNSNKTIGFAAHIDTLGLMVRSINSDGTLMVTNIGSPIIPTLDGEYCKVYTRNGDMYTGTILSTSPAAHVFDDSRTKERSIDNIMIRLDEIVKSKEDVKKLNIDAGDFVCMDTKTVITENGFIKSRFLDDKLSVGAFFGVLKYIKECGIVPNQNIKFFISTYEEVGHGLSYLPEVDELIAVDMGCIGLDLNCTEYDVSICAKDSSGPYDYEIVNKLISLSLENNIDYKVDIYPYYGSDVSAALRGGNDFRGGLIGPGVSASHGMERSHYHALLNTMKLMIHYIMS